VKRDLRSNRVQPPRLTGTVRFARPMFRRPERLAAARPERVRNPPTRERLLAVAVAVVQVLTARPGIGVRKLRTAVRAVLGPCTDGDTDAALHLLGEAVQCEDGPRGSYRFTLDMSQVPPDVQSRLGAAVSPS
jgi:hypothetical protein